MKITKIKKVYYYELLNKYREKHGEMDYRVRNFLEDLCDSGLYKYDYSNSTPSKWRITFPLFITVIGLSFIYGCFKWLFTGNNLFSEKSTFVKFMVKWDKYCGFKII